MSSQSLFNQASPLKHRAFARQFKSISQSTRWVLRVGCNLIVSLSLLMTSAGPVSGLAYSQPVAQSTGTPASSETPTIEPTASESPTPEPTATSEATLVVTDAPDDSALAPTLVFTPTETLSPSVTVTPSPTPSVSNTVIINPTAGGVLSTTDGLLQIEFPASAVTQTTSISYQAAPPQQAVTVENGVAFAHKFTMLAQTATGPGASESFSQSIRQFARPLTFTLQLAQLGFAPGQVEGRSLWFGYYSEASGEWIRIPFALDQSGEAVTVRALVDHFTEFGVGQDANPGWKLTFNEPSVSLFSGAGTFNYPLSLPPGRGGVGPSLSLSYNSRGVDHNRSWSQSDWVGHGWSLDTMEIVRRIGDTYTTQSNAECTTDFSLNFNGTTYRLFPSTGVTVTGQYYSQEDSGLYIERLYSASAPNAGDTYWRVVDPSGTVYRFGWNGDAEQLVPGGCAYAGDSFPTQFVFRWRLDQVKDLYGNEMALAYQEEARQACGGGTQPGERASYLYQIKYNNLNKPGTQWMTQIDLNRLPRETGDGNDDGHGACDKLFFQADYLKNVTVSVNGVLTRKFDLGYQLFVDTQRGTSGTASRELMSVTESGYDSAGNNPVTLPATTFTYVSLGNSDSADCLPNVNCGPGPGPNTDGTDDGWNAETWSCRWYTDFPGQAYQAWMNPSQFGRNGPYDTGHEGNWYDCTNFNYWRLYEIRNGYGAKTTFTYGNDGRGTYWLGGFAYRVDRRTIAASETGPAATWDYTYATPCYNNNLSTDPLPTGGIQCKLPSPAKADGQLMGYGVVTATVKDYDGVSILNKTTHYFKTYEEGTRLMGREYRTENRDGAGNLLSTQDTTYGVVDSDTNRWRTFTDSQYSRTYDGATFKDTRTSFSSDGYGNQTAGLSYGAEEPVVNPGFEAGLGVVNSSFEAGMQTWTPYWSPSPASITTTNPLLGQKSLLLTGSTNGGAYQDVGGLKPGQVYTISAWVKATSGASAKFNLWLHDNAGGASVTTTATSPGTSWTQVMALYTATTSGQIRVHLNYTNGTGTIFVDQVSLNGRGWNVFGISVPSPATVITGTATALAGVTSLQLQSTNAGGVWQEVPIANGVAYTARVWVRASSTGNTAQFKLRLHDGAGSNTQSTTLTTITTTWQLVTVNYTGNGTGKVRIHLEYGSVGNGGPLYIDEVALARQTDYGDEHSSYTAFYPNTTPSVWILSRPGRASTYLGIWPDDSNTAKLLTRTRYRYNDTCVSTPPTGVITATVVEQWRGGVGTESCNYDATFIATRSLVDGWGNSTAQSSPFTVGTANIYTATTQYDSAYRLYPIAVTTPVTNGVSFTTYTQYDYRLGVPTVITDVNNAATTLTYDKFGRLYEVFKPGDGTDPSVRYIYKDISTANPGPWLSPFVIVSWQKPNSLGYAQRHIYDGLGREIQTHTATTVTVSGSSAPADILVSTRYNALGQVISQTVPYTTPAYVSSSTNPYTTINLSAAPKTLMQYDALGRTSVITAADGTVSKQFYGLTLTGSYASAPWWSAGIDANSHAKRSYTNALGQTRWIQEFTGTCTAGTLSGCSVYATTQYSYTVLGQLNTVTDTLNNTTVITYNILGQKIGMKDPDMGVWGYQYDVAGNLITQTDALNQTLLFAYDAANRLVQKRVMSSTVLATYTYDEYNTGNGQYGRGQRTRLLDTAGVTVWKYNQLGQVVSQTQSISITNPTARTFTTLFLYDSVGRPISTTLPTNETITQTYNNLGALENVKSTSATFGSPWYATNLDYNANGSLAKLELGNGVRTLYGYYGLQANPWDAKPSAGLVAYGRLWTARTETPVGATVQDNRYSYDNVGNIASLYTLPRSLVVTATANLTDTFTSGTISTTLWTVTGSVTSPSGAALFSCSGSCTPPELVRKTNTITDAGSVQVRFQVNNAAAAFVLGLESGTKQTSSYRRLAVYAHNNALWVQYNDGSSSGAAFREPTMLTSTLLANTWYTVTITTSNARGQTIELYKQGDNTAYEKHATYTIFLASGVNWRFHAWGPSVSGQTLTLDDYREFPASQKYVPDEHQTYTYDELDRLKTVSKTFADGYTAVYTYTAIGNLIGKTEGTSTQTFNLGAQQGGCSGGALSKAHAPKEMVANGSTNPLCHDANGNMTQRVEMSGTQAITYLQGWDKENRLTVVTNTATSPALITKFYYTGDGARVKKTEQNNGGAVITTTFYAGALEVISTTQTVTRTHYMAGAQLVAVREVTNTTSAGNLTYLHSDHLGSTSTTTCGNTGGCGTTPNGGVLSRQSYYPYGSVRSTTGTLPTSHTYTGQVSDGAGTGGLMYYNARFYSPGLARFASADSIVPNPGNPQAFNRYSYVLNSPLKYTDPSGHRQESCSSNSDDCVKSSSKKLTRSSKFTIATTNPRSGYCYLCDNLTPGKHPGEDLNDAPDPNVRASGNGIVIVADRCSANPCERLVGNGSANVNGGYGNVMIVEYPYATLPLSTRQAARLHETESLFMLYAHLEAMEPLIAGSIVDQGQIVAQIGTTGSSDGPHLHLEVRVGETGSLQHSQPDGPLCTFTCQLPSTVTNPAWGDPKTLWVPFWAMRHIDPNTSSLYYDGQVAPASLRWSEDN